MKSFFTFIAISIVTINIAFAQNYHSGTITTNDQQTVEGRVSIDNYSKKVLNKKSGDSDVFSFSNIKNVTVSGISYSVITFNNEEYLANILASGKASLYSLTNDDFLIVDENNKGQIFNLNQDKQQIPGTLSLLFNDCNPVRDEINKTEDFSEKTLTKIIFSYNNCNYGNYVPTENEINKANTFNTDTFRFYAALLSSFNNTTVNDFASNNSNGFGLGIGLASSPSFMGKLKGNIYIDFDFSMIFSGNSDFNNGVTPLNYKVNSYRLSLGVEYVFNKEGMLSPFLGIGYGYTSDYYNGTLGTIDIKDQEQNYFFVPKVGVLYKLKNEKHFGLTLSYISEYENNLSFVYDEAFNPLVIKNSFITIGLSYYF